MTSTSTQLIPGPDVIASVELADHSIFTSTKDDRRRPYLIIKLTEPDNDKQGSEVSIRLTHLFRPALERLANDLAMASVALIDILKERKD